MCKYNFVQVGSFEQEITQRIYWFAARKYQMYIGFHENKFDSFNFWIKGHEEKSYVYETIRSKHKAVHTIL